MVEEDSVILGEYTYNGLGQRIIKEVDGVTTIFHYDFDGNIIGESDASGNFSKEYLYRGSSRLALVDVSSGEMYYYGNDRLGTLQILTDSSNKVVWEAVYDPFGKADINPNSTVVSNFRFPGQYFDSETGLHYNYHRYYDPSTGRYLIPDPSHLIQPTGVEIPFLLPYFLIAPHEFNNYIYSLNNPIMNHDESGLFSYSCAKRVAKKYNNLIANDKYKHCIVAAEIYTECGPFTAYLVSVGKEIQDMFGPGEAEWADFTADLAGISCAQKPGEICEVEGKTRQRTIDECCRSKGYKP